MDCQAASGERKESGVNEFLRRAKAAGRSVDTAFHLFLSGRDVEGEAIATGEWLDRGATLGRLQSQWMKNQ